MPPVGYTESTQFGQITKRAAQKSERFVFGCRGAPSVVIMSVRDYMRTFAPAPKELRAMQATAKRTGADSLTTGQVNRIVAAVRREQKPQSAATFPEEKSARRGWRR
jgi:ribosomal protein S2